MNERLARVFAFHAVILVALNLLLVGCAVNQEDDVAAYRAVYDPPTTEPVHIQPGQTLTLTEALRIANRNQEKLASQGETYLQELIAKDLAFAHFLPTVSVGPAYSFQDPHGSGPGSKNTSFNVPAGGGINLFNGFRDVANLKLADANIEQQKQLLLDLQQSILLDVVQTYYQILTAEQSVEVLTNSLKVQDAQVHNIKARAALGVAKDLDVAQQEAQASQTRFTLNQDIANVNTGRSMLAYLIDAPVENCPLIDDFKPPEKIQAVEEFLAQAESSRQDLLAAKSAIDAGRQQCEIAFGAYYPTLSLNLGYFLYKDINPADNVWNGSISASIPIDTDGSIHAGMRQAWSVFRQAALAQANLRRSVDNDVKTAYINLQLARRQLNELQVQVEAARAALFLAQQTYQNGGGTLLNQLIAQDTLLTSQLELTTAQFQQKTAYFNLVRVTGKLSLTIATAATQPSEQHIRNLATQPVTQPIIGATSRPARLN